MAPPIWTMLRSLVWLVWLSAISALLSRRLLAPTRLECQLAKAADVPPVTNEQAETSDGSESGELDLEVVQRQVELQLRLRQLLRRMDEGVIPQENLDPRQREQKKERSKTPLTLAEAAQLMKRRQEMELELEAARRLIAERDS